MTETMLQAQLTVARRVLESAKNEVHRLNVLIPAPNLEYEHFHVAYRDHLKLILKTLDEVKEAKAAVHKLEIEVAEKSIAESSNG